MDITVKDLTREARQQKKVTDMSIKDMDDLIFYTTKRVDNLSFRGIYPFIRQQQDEMKEIKGELEEIKTLLKGLNAEQENQDV